MGGLTRPEPGVPAGRSFHARRWWGVLALLSIITIAYVDRVNISVLVVDPGFLRAFGLQHDRVGQGALMTLFLLGYGAAAMLLTPFYESVLGYRRGLLISLFAWAVLTALAPLAGSLLALLVLRVLLGTGEGPLFSLKTMFIYDNFASHEWGKPNAISSMGVSLGLALGFPLVSYLLSSHGWVGSFYVLAAVNLLLGLPLAYWLIPMPRSAGAAGCAARRAFRDALRTRHLGLLLLVEVCTLAYLWGSSAWLPAYLVGDKHFSIKEMGWISSLPFLVGLGANFLGGALVDAFPKRLTPLIFTLGGGFCALAVLLLIGSRAMPATVVFLLLSSACWAMQGAAIPTLVQRFAPAGSVGSAYGIVNGVGNVVAAFMPTAMGGLMKTYVASGFALLVASQIGAAVGGIWLCLKQTMPEMAGPAAGGGLRRSH